MSVKKRILVVDDEPDYVSLVKMTLEKEGFEVETAIGGQEGLAKVRSRPPDLIVLDVMMPDLDGYAVCSELKSDAKHSKIPVIMLTAVASQVPSTRYSHYDGMTMEAEDYIPKPAPPGDLVASIKRLLRA